MAESSFVKEEINALVYVRGDEGSYGGWRTDLLVEEMTVEAKFLLCSCCRGVLREACLFEKDGKQELRCSVCMPSGVNKQTAQMNRGTVNEKQVHCPFKNKGCDWTKELSGILHHLDECVFFPVQCPLGCGEKVEGRAIDTHRTSCPMREGKCEYCDRKVHSCQMNAHLKDCEEFPISCPNECGESFRVERKNKLIHLNQECPLQEIECSYSEYGCKVKSQRRHMDLHEKENIHKHLKLTMGRMQGTVTTLEKELKYRISTLEKENKELKVQNEEFQASLTKVARLILEGSLEWKITDVENNISLKKITYSDSFYVGLYKFQGKFLCDCKENNVGCSLIIMKGEWDDTLKWPLRYKFSIILINKLDTSNSMERKHEVTEKDLKKFPECFKKPSTERNEIGFGFSKFISNAAILQEKYSKDDSVTIRFAVKLLVDTKYC